MSSRCFVSWWSVVLLVSSVALNAGDASVTAAKTQINKLGLTQSCVNSTGTCVTDECKNCAGRINSGQIGRAHV